MDGLNTSLPSLFYSQEYLDQLKVSAMEHKGPLFVIASVWIASTGYFMLTKASERVNVTRLILKIAGLLLFVWFAHSNAVTSFMDSLLKEGVFQKFYLPIMYSFLGVIIFQILMGSQSKKNESKMQLDDEARKKRNYPPPYPNGWYVLLESHELAIGSVKGVKALGQDFVVFRGEDSKVSVLDSYCPHMGANLSAGGKVVGNELLCPFHEWRFEGSGKCTHIPYSDNVPSNANVKSWHTTEYYGMILIYFDAENREPPYYLDELPELKNGDFYYCDSTERTLRMHIIEFVENSADFQHFDILHGEMAFPFTQIKIPGITIKHDPGFSTDGSRVTFTDNASLKFCGYDIPRSEATAIVNILGPGSSNYFRFKTELGDILLFHMHTPEEPLLQKARFRWYAANSVPKLLAAYIVGTWISQVESDRQVWENKVYMNKPLLVKGDGPIVKVRRWFKQFYTENSRNIANGKLDW